MIALRELLVSFGIEVNGAEKLDQVDKGLKNVVGKFRDFSQAILGGIFATAITGFVKHQIAAGDALGDMAERLGVGVDELESFQFAAELSGASAEDATTAFRFLNKNIGEALQGGEAAKAFTDLKVAIKDSGGNVRELGDLVPDLADSFAKMGSQQERTAAAMKIFGRGGAALVPLLSKGSAGVKELFQDFQDLGGGLGKAFVEEASKADDQLIRLRYASDALKSRILVGVLPTITSFIKRLVSITGEARKLVKETNALKVAMAAFGVFGALVALNSLIKLAKAFGLVADGAGLFKSLISVGWLGLIALAIAAVVLIVEDLYTLFTGGQSVIGEFLDSMFGIGTAGKFVAAVNEEVDRLLATFNTLKPIVELITNLLPDGFKSFGDILSKYVRFAVANIVVQLETVVIIVQTIAKVLGKVIETAGKFAAIIPGLKELGIDPDKLKNVGKQIQETSSAGIASATGNMKAAVDMAKGTTTNNMTEGDKNVTVNVYGYYDDPKKVGDAAAKSTTRALGDERQSAFGALARTAP